MAGKADLSLSTAQQIILRDNKGQALRPVILSTDIVNFSTDVKAQISVTDNGASLYVGSIVNIATVNGTPITAEVSSNIAGNGLSYDSTNKAIKINTGTGLNITSDVLHVNIDNSTIKTNGSGQLYADKSVITAGFQAAIAKPLNFSGVWEGTSLPTDTNLVAGNTWIKTSTKLSITNTQALNGTAQSVEIGDLLIYAGDSKWVVSEKNVDGSVNTSTSLTEGKIVIGSGNETINISTITNTNLVDTYNLRHGSADLNLCNTTNGTSNTNITAATLTTAYITIKNGTTNKGKVGIKSGEKLTVAANNGILTIDHVSINLASQNGDKSSLNYGSDVITGINTDSYGHITSFNVGTLPAKYVHPTNGANTSKGSATEVPVITVDSLGHVTSLTSATIDRNFIKTVAVYTGTGAGAQIKDSQSATAGSATSILGLHAGNNVNITLSTYGIFSISATDTTYNSGNVITVDASNKNINHNKVITIGTGTSIGTYTNNTLTCPKVTVDNYGHITKLESTTFTAHQGIQKITPSKSINASCTIDTYTTAVGGVTSDAEIKLGTGLYLSTDYKTITTGLYFEYV